MQKQHFVIFKDKTNCLKWESNIYQSCVCVCNIIYQSIFAKDTKQLFLTKMLKNNLLNPGRTVLWIGNFSMWMKIQIVLERLLFPRDQVHNLVFGIHYNSGFRQISWL